ncbi:hypothetical protein K523DRAFT_228353 [Schizophyllum commune Tattone D]|nr:hypothetical protein K523DRAFT_228353 [Schizophyllum commune Tattone D]
MADIIRSPSIQSFMSTDSLSMLASPTPEALATSSSALHGDDAPRATAATEFDDEPVAQSAPQAHCFYLKDGNVKFKLDDGMMYNVHRYFFDKHAPSFSHEYLCEGAEGTVALQGVSSTDLDRFLAMVYPSDIGDCDIHTVDEWTSVLRLAVKWSIPNLRARALREIEPRASPVEKVVIGREFALGKAWLLPAFVAICGARECLGYADAARLGLRTVVEIGRIREDYQIQGTVTNLAEAVRASGMLTIASAEVHPSFGLDDAAAVPLDAANSNGAPILPHTQLSAVDDTNSKFTQARAEPQPPPIDSDVAAARFAPHPTNTGACLEQIKDYLEYLALRAAENTEMADVCNTDLDRALYAGRLHDRLANEKSPAALRHQEWRRERLNCIYRDFLQNIPALRYEVDLSRNDSWSAAKSISYIERVLAPNIVHQRLPVSRELVDDDLEDNREDHLSVVFSPSQFALKQQIKDRLEE